MEVEREKKHCTIDLEMEDGGQEKNGNNTM